MTQQPVFRSRTCIRCYRPFPAYQPKQIFCTPNCRKAHWRETHPKCLNCRKRFPKTNYNRVYCSKNCSSQRTYHLRRVANTAAHANLWGHSKPR
jgi:hypothetical protein